MTFMIAVGKWGGIYFINGFLKRLCIGWVALTFIPVDEGDFLSAMNAATEKPGNDSTKEGLT